MKLHSVKSLILGIITFYEIRKVRAIGELGNYRGKSLADTLAVRDLEKEESIRKIFSQTPSDKVEHGYVPMYASLFAEQGPFDMVIEFGIGATDTLRQTNSLTAWSEISKNSKIIGFDIDKKSFFNDMRVTSYFADQTDWKSMEHDVLARIKGENPKQVLIVDDGLHEPSAFINVIKVFNILQNMNLTLVIEDLRLTYFLLLFLWNKSFGYKGNAVFLAHRKGKQVRVTKLRHILFSSWNWNNVFVISRYS
jgi:hypothetical protein